VTERISLEGRKRGGFLGGRIELVVLGGPAVHSILRCSPQAAEPNDFASRSVEPPMKEKLSSERLCSE
jgi:hypothetical protein